MRDAPSPWARLFWPPITTMCAYEVELECYCELLASQIASVRAPVAFDVLALNPMSPTLRLDFS